MTESLLVIIEAGIEVLPERINNKMDFYCDSPSSSLATLFEDSNLAGTE